MSNLATIVNNILADSGIDDINVVVTNGSYSNPAWITALSWSKITSTPTTLSGYGITDAVPANRTITINGTAQDLSVNRSWSVGTVTSVDMTVPTGFSISGSPITSSGTLALTFSAGYSLPTTAVQSNWTTAYNDSIVSAAVSGTTTKTLTLTQQDGGTITASWTDYDTAPVTSVNAGTGISVNQTTGAVTVTNTGVLVNDITSSSGQGRFGGWYQGNGYTGAAVEAGFSGGNGNVISYNRSTGSYQPLYITGSNLYLQQSGGLVWINSQLVRQAAGQGWLSGNYASSETAATTGAIYSIGGSYYPTSTTLNTMYGVGYTHSDQGQMPSGASSWGFYVAAYGTAKVWLGADNGNIIASGDIYANTSSIVATRTWVNSQGFITGGPYLPLSGGTLTGPLTIGAGGSYPLAISSTQRYMMQVRNTNNTVNSGYGWWWFMDTNFNMGFHADGAADRMTLTRAGDLYLTSNMYVNGNGSSTGTQVVYNSGTWGISITGNADTVDGYHATNAASGLAYYASNGYLYVPSWINVDNGGIFSSTNNAHIRPNTGNYGSWSVIGSRNNYRGFEFESGTNGNVALMINVNSNATGFYNPSYGWQFYWEAGTFYIYKNNYGGGTAATALDSSNYNSYAPTLTGTGASGTWGINITGSSGTAGSTQTLAYTYLGSGSVNVNNSNGAIYRTDSGSGAVLAYSPVLHIGAGDTMWQVQGSYGTSGNGTFYFRQGYNGSWGNWLTMLSSANYNTYSPTLTGGGASGTWGINVTGTAASETLSTVTNRGNSTGTSIYIDAAGEGFVFRTGGASWGGWARNTHVISTSANTVLAAFGGYGGDGNSLSYSYIGLDYITNWIRFSSSAVNSQVALQQGGNQVLHAGNYSSYALPLTGGTITGVVTINGGGTQPLTLTTSSNGPWALNLFRSDLSSSSRVFNNGGFWYFEHRPQFNGNLALDAANYSSYALPLSGGTMTGAITTPAGTSIYMGGQNVSTSSRIVINWHSDGDYNYLIGKRAGAWTQPMDIAFYTGLRYHANSTYNGHIFYVGGYDINEAFSIGRGDSNVRVTNTLYSYAYRGNGNVDGTGEASYHPAGIYSTGNNWLYGTLYLAGSNIRSAGGFGQGNTLSRPNTQWGATSATGPVVIKFPGNSSNYGMVHAVIDIYEYNGNNVSTVIVGGHNWASYWVNYGANVIGYTDKPVRVAFKDGQYCIVIGNSGSSWSYGQVVLRKIQNGTYYSGSMELVSGITIGIESDSYSWVSGDLRQLRVPGNIYMNETLVATQSWVNSQGFVTGGPFVPVSGGINMTGSFGLNDNRLYLRTNGDNNHYIWNADDDWEELVYYTGTGFRIKGSAGSVPAYITNSAVYAGAYRGKDNVGGTGEASYHPAGIYSTGTNWLYGTMYLNNNVIYDAGTIHLYDSSRSFLARYTAGSNIYAGTLNWYGLQLGNNGDNYIIAGRTATGGALVFYTNNTSDFTTVNGTFVAKMHSTGRTTFGSATDYGYALSVAGSFFATDWIRVNGTSGLYFESYGGGWRMTDSSYIRAYNGKALSMEGASVDYVSSIYMNGGVYIQTFNNRNLIVKSTGSSDAGILGRGSGDQFAFQVYGSGGDYGFLNSAWGAWDIRKTANGSLYMNDNTSYYLNTTSSSVSANINGAILSNSSFGTNGWGASSNAAAGRVYGPKGAAYSYSGGTIYGAIKIRLPFRNSDGMWSMKVRIYNYAQQQTSEYLLGNYSYSQGAYNFSATYLGGSSSNAFTVRFGNDGSYDCVWIGETGTGWSYPVVSVMDFMMGYSNGNVSNYYQNWDISIVGSFETVGATVAPNIKFGNAFASYYYDSADSTYYVRPSSLSYMHTVSSFYVQNNYGVSSDHAYGIYFDSGRSTAYAIFRESGAWDFPYPDLRIAFHTGIKIGANASYKGVRFYTDYDMSGLVLSVNNADYNTGGIYVHGTAYASAYYETSDARVKKILEDNSRVNGIESIKPKLYEKDGKTEFGYIAQDFLEIMPYAINNDNKDGYYSLVYREVHTAKIAYLEDSIEEIKAKILYLENQLKTKQ